MNTESPLQFKGLGDRFLQVASSAGGRAAVVTADETYSFGDLALHVRRAATALDANGVGPGARFAVLSRNSATILELILAASLSGAVLVPLNFRLAPRELAHILSDCGASLLFVEDDWLPLLSEIGDGLTTIRVAEHGQTDEYRAWRSPRPPPLDQRPLQHVPNHDSIVVQMYTTGTTGVPKGVLISEGNLAAMTSKVPEIFMVSTDSIYLALLPMFHISGSGTPLAVLCVGGRVVLSSGTTAAAILQDLTSHRITHVNLVPSLIGTLLTDLATRAADLGSLEVLMYGAAPSNSGVIEEASRLLPTCWFLHGYGLTECTGGVAYAEPIRFGDEHHSSESVGRSAPGCEIRIVDPRTLDDVSRGDAGEVWVRSAQNTIGYWNRPEETAALYAEQGWLRTGDIGLIDADGSLHLKDRLKDMIISGGENIYSAEVEHAIASHPAVAEAAVYGVPDAKWGESVKAVVTLRPGCTASPQELIDHTRARLAHYKCPRLVEVVDELPKSGTGKVLKRVLRDPAR